MPPVALWHPWAGHMLQCASIGPIRYAAEMIYSPKHDAVCTKLRRTMEPETLERAWRYPCFKRSRDEQTGQTIMTLSRTLSWHPDEDVTPSPRDVENMACVLEGQHGSLAADVAEFFASLHAEKNDAGRTWAWAGVAESVRYRQRLRLQQK